MAAPSMTLNTAGNGLASGSLAASATTNFNLDLSAVFEGHVQIGATFGTVAATSGLKVEVFPRVGSTPVNDTVDGPGSFTLASVASTAQAVTIKLPTGKYNIKLTNLDATNGLTLVYSTWDSVSAVS